MPRIGSFCSQGKPETARRVSSWIRPAITKEPPEGSSIEVSARRTDVAGMVTVDVPAIGTETAPVAEISLTSRAHLQADAAGARAPPA